jgi:hypothetical protein
MRLVLCYLCALSVSLVVFTVATHAQANPNIDQGFHPYGSYEGGSVDTVSLSNGALNIQIPVVSYPQRGDLHLSFSLRYGSKAWSVAHNSGNLASWTMPNQLGPVLLGTSRQFEASGLNQAHWSDASPIRKIFREAFVRAGLPYFNPHSFRNTLVQFGQDICKSPEEFKAWSQNLGHEQVLTTFRSYGEVASHRQGEIIRGLAAPQSAARSDADRIAEAVFQRLCGTGADVRVSELIGRAGLSEQPEITGRE